MRTAAFILVATAVASGCTLSARRPEFSGGYPVYDCPPHLEGQVHISAEAVTISGSAARDYSVPTVGAVRRRLSLAVTPAGWTGRRTLIERP